MRSAASQSIVCNQRSGIIGFPAPALPSPFRVGSAVFSSATVPRCTCVFGFILSYASRLSRVLPFSVRPRPEGPRRLPWGCGPSSRHQPTASVLRASHRSTPCRPRRFSRPRRFPPRLALWVYFTPLPRLGLTLQGFAPRPQPFRLSAIACPLVVVPTLLRAVAHSRRLVGPRPQGFSPRPSP